MVSETLRRVLTQEADAIALMAESLTPEFEKAVEWMVSCTGRVICCGLGKSGHIARKAAGTLASTGTPSLFMHASEAGHGDLGMVTERDIVIMYSHSGESDELMRLFPPLKVIGARTILITGRPQSSVGDAADLALSTFVTAEACPNNLAPTTSTTAMLALSDALAVAVMEVRGFGRDRYAVFHPAGALGKRLLLTVGDVMRSGADLALARPDDSLLEVLRAITQAGAGAACIVDDAGGLVGFFTDGDFRRHVVATGDHSAPVSTLMKLPSMTVGPDILAVEALEIFQNMEKKIGELPVVADKKVVGLLALKDLLRSGIF